MSTLRAAKGSTDTLLWYPPAEHLAQASAADVRISTPSTTLPDEGSEQAATVDSVSTTLAAAASRGDSSVTVASASGIVEGRRYLVEDDGEKYVVQVAEVDGTEVHLTGELPGPVSSGAPFVGIAITHQLTADETSDTGAGLLIARMTLDGVQHTKKYKIRIVEQVFAIALDLPQIMRRRDITRYQQADDLDFLDVRDAAWDDVLRPKLEGRGFLVERINTPEKMNPPLLEAMALLLKRAAGEPFEEIDAQEMRLKRALDDAQAGSEFWYDAAESDAVSDERQGPTARDVAWLSR
jgi:hypothetical protein